MRPSGPTESDQQVSESGLRENGYHFTGYGVSPGDLASASKAGTRFAESAVVPIFINVRRSISCPELIHSSVVDQKPGDYIPDRAWNLAFLHWCSGQSFRRVTLRFSTSARLSSRVKCRGPRTAVERSSTLIS